MRAPDRFAFGTNERNMVVECLNYYESQAQDPPYSGHFQRRFESDFSSKMRGGYSLAVSSGSNASYVAIRSLELPKNKNKILMSPVTDTSSLISILLAGYTPIILDTTRYSYNTSLEQVLDAYRRDVGAVYLVHSYGVNADVVNISNFCRRQNLKLIEDCSQSPFASVDSNTYVGSYGDISVFSTMYRKSLHTSSSGGVLFTKSVNLYHSIVEYSDRGRSKWDSKTTKFDEGNVKKLSLNFNTNEFSCAIGIASLARINSTISRRMSLVKRLVRKLSPANRYLDVMKFPEGSSVFLVPIIFTSDGQKHMAKLFDVLTANSIPHAPEYHCFAYDWDLAKRNTKLVNRLRGDFIKIYFENACRLKQSSFNLYLHEGYNEEYVDFISSRILQVFDL
jgi:dTDP-4-amino-4,6-dideoxygalactose transaminase